MKKVLSLFLICSICIACDKDEPNPTIKDPEKFEAVFSGDLKGEMVYDESKYVGVSAANSPLTDDFDSYVAITGVQMDPVITINFYPPDDHPRSSDVISITIKSKDPKPWALDKEYRTPYINQLLNYPDHAIVSYWNGEDRVDYISFYTFENTNSIVKVWREGGLLKGEIKALKLYNFNGNRRLNLERLVFQVRPEDDDLKD